MSVSLVNSLGLCQNCNIRPRYTDRNTGIIYLFCSRGCPGTPSSNNTGKKCNHCKSCDKFSDGTQTYQFCSKTCAQLAQLAEIPRLSSPSGICFLPGCSRPVYKDDSGKPSMYCSKSHKIEAEMCCLGCQKFQSQFGSHFCKTCAEHFEKNAPMILRIPQTHSVYQSVALQFQMTWKIDGPRPGVRAIYKIISSQKDIDQYEEYRATVEADGRFQTFKKPIGNENRRWHGTDRECNLGDQGHTTLCYSQTCSLCCIIRTSYDLSLFGKKHPWGRFGRGIYCSSNPAKSNDYSKNIASSPCKALLLNKVVVGRAYKPKENSPNLTAPPEGFDSVIGEPGTTVNKDEVVVYTEDAILPCYLVMYDII